MIGITEFITLTIKTKIEMLFIWVYFIDLYFNTFIAVIMSSIEKAELKRYLFCSVKNKTKTIINYPLLDLMHLDKIQWYNIETIIMIIN